MASFVRVCSKGDFVHNRYLATVNDKQVAILQIDGKYYGISNVSQCSDFATSIPIHMQGYCSNSENWS